MLLIRGQLLTLTQLHVSDHRLPHQHRTSHKLRRVSVGGGRKIKQRGNTGGKGNSEDHNMMRTNPKKNNVLSKWHFGSSKFHLHDNLCCSHFIIESQLFRMNQNEEHQQPAAQYKTVCSLEHIMKVKLTAWLKIRGLTWVIKTYFASSFIIDLS